MAPDNVYYIPLWITLKEPISWVNNQRLTNA